MMSKDRYLKAVEFVKKNARPLDKALYAHEFEEEHIAQIRISLPNAL